MFSAIFVLRVLVLEGFLLGPLLLSLSCYFSICLCSGVGAAGTRLSEEVLVGLGDVGDPLQPL